MCHFHGVWKVENNLCCFFQIDREVLNIMSNPKKGRPFRYSNDVTDLLRFIRNLDEHPDTRYALASLPLPQLYCREHLGIRKRQ